MEDNKTINENAKKLTYKELEAAMYNLTEKLNKAYKDNQYLVNQLNGINNTFTRLNYLFKVLENSQHFNSDFIIECAEEIENTITVPETSDNKDDTSENTENTEDTEDTEKN